MELDCLSHMRNFLKLFSFISSKENQWGKTMAKSCTAMTLPGGRIGD